MTTHELLKNINAGLVSGAFALLLGISFASFVFTGHLAPYLPIGFGLAIVSVIALRLVIARYSEIPGIVPSPFVVVCIFLALMTTSINNHLASQGLNSQIFPTSLTIIAAATFSIAIAVTLLGLFKLGNLVRYVPYPVTSGLLTGIGISMILRGIDVIAGKPLTAHNFTEAFSLELLPQILVALGIAYLIYLLMQGRLRTFSKILVGIGLFLFFSAIYFWINSPTPHHWFFGPIPSGRLYPPDLTSGFFSNINWSEIRGQLGPLLTMNFIFILSYLVNINGIEDFLKRDLNVNRELKITGYANFFTTLLGGIGGCLSTTQTIPNILQGGTKYVATIAATILGVLVLFINAEYLNYIPKSILAAVPIFLGSLFVLEWGYKSRFRLPLVDFLLLAAIAAASLVFGFVPATVFGILAAAAIFLVNYSRSEIVKFHMDGKVMRSNVQRTGSEEEFLEEHGHQAYILKLQGYIFFGSAYRLLQMIQKELFSPHKDPVKYLVLDFEHVNELDSSAVLSFAKLLELTKTNPFITLFSHANERIVKQLKIAGYKETDAPLYHFFPNLDYAVEWYENQILSSHSFEAEPNQSNAVKDILGHADRVQVKKGDYVIKDGEYSDDLYYLESGKVTAQIEKNSGSIVRLLTIKPGAFIGEIGFFAGKSRLNAVKADEDSVLQRISREKLTELQKTHPGVVINFYQELLGTLSERVAAQNRAVDMLTHE